MRYLLFSAFMIFIFACTQKRKVVKQQVLDPLYAYMLDSNKIKLRDGTKFYLDTVCFPSGRIKVIKTFVDSMPNGYSMEFYENGKVKQINFYLHGQLDDYQTYYFPSGGLKSKERYIYGKLFGSMYIYRENGMLDQYNFFDANGNLAYQRLYNDRGETVQEHGSPIVTFAVNLHPSTTYHVGDSARFLILLARPPHCSYRLNINDGNADFANTNIIEPLPDFISPLTKPGKYSYKVDYTLYDSTSRKQTFVTRTRTVTVL